MNKTHFIWLISHEKKLILFGLVILLVDKIRVDDPVGCVGVHWGAGVWAMIATGFFANTDKIQGGDEGIFRGGSGKMLGMNVAMVLATTVWSGGCTFILVSKDQS